jgi:hypothetical protein
MKNPSSQWTSEERLSVAGEIGTRLASLYQSYWPGDIYSGHYGLHGDVLFDLGTRLQALSAKSSEYLEDNRRRILDGLKIG